VTEGAVTIGGVNVKDIDKSELMNTVSYVFQDSKLLKRSILENVRLGRPSATEQEVIEALNKAQCADIIAKLPDGIHTVIGTKGVYLSGGEQQRIAIARAILKNAPVVVLDEATAFADPENEYLVQKSFAELAKDKTVIMIAHRLSTIQNADNIIVLENGKIAEQGTHGNLLKQNGIYKKMWDNYQSSIAWKVGEHSA
jgi:ATP-binding cassette subfamily B protein